MKSVGAHYEEASRRKDIQPRFLLVFDGLSIRLTNYESAVATDWPLIKEVGSFSGSIYPDEGRADVGACSVKIIDDERFHQLLPNLPREKRVTLYGGFHNVAEADWLVLMSGLIQDLDLDGSLGEWTLSLNDLQLYRVKDCFRKFGKTKLNGAHADGAVTFNVDSTDGSATGDFAFHDPADADCNGWFLCDGEICSYSGMTPTSFTGVTRGQLIVAGGAEAKAHSNDAAIQELFVLIGNPIDILLQLYTSTGTGLNGPYDVWEAEQGLGIDDALIDVATFESIRDTWLIGETYRFVLKAPIDVKKWTEEQIFKPANAYPLVTGAGLMSVRLYNPPFGYQPAVVDINNVFQIRGWTRGLERLINNTVFSYDYDVVAGEYRAYQYDLEAVSINKHGLSPTYKCECQGLYSDLSAETIVDRRITRIWFRYADGCPSFAARVRFDAVIWDAGDIVSVTLPKLPDILLGTRGVADQWMEVTSWRPAPEEGAVDCEIWDTRIAGRFGGIAPNATPDYSLATDAEKNYCFISDQVTGLMPNGDPPYLIL